MKDESIHHTILNCCAFNTLAISDRLSCLSTGIGSRRLSLDGVFGIMLVVPLVSVATSSMACLSWRPRPLQPCIGCWECSRPRLHGHRYPLSLLQSTVCAGGTPGTTRSCSLSASRSSLPSASPPSPSRLFQCDRGLPQPHCCCSLLIASIVATMRTSLFRVLLSSSALLLPA